jgi:hypothetical protein
LALSPDELRAGLEKIILQLESLRPSSRDSTSVTYDEMVSKTGLEEGEFRELYLVFESKLAFGSEDGF